MRHKGLMAVQCPLCERPDHVCKAGTRPTANKAVQRWLCRACHYRFSKSEVKLDIGVKTAEGFDAGLDNSEKVIVSDEFAAEKIINSSSFKVGEDSSVHGVTSIEKGLNPLCFCTSNAEKKQEGRKMSSAVQAETATARTATFDTKTARGLMLQYSLYLQKEGYGQDCRYKSCIHMLINSGTNLLDPDNVKETIAKKSWKDGTKMQVTYAYDALVRMLKLSWEMPKYRQEEIIPYIPDEKDLDALVAGAGSQRMSAYLQCLKETMTDPSEALRVKWIDIKDNVITINRPVKGHYPRQIEVSNTLISTLNTLPKTSEYVFPTTYKIIGRCYYKVRQKLAKKLNNPRLLAISLVTFRHWGATMLYFRTNNILLVKKMLGHKNIQNTMKYTQLVNFKDDDYEVTTATTKEEIKNLGKAGFMKYDEQNGIHFYRKPKRFVSLA